MSSRDSAKPTTTNSLAEKWFGSLLDLSEKEQFRTDENVVDDEILTMFQEEIASATEELALAVPEKDWMKVREVAHSLQGMGGVVGVPEISLLGLELSNAAKSEAGGEVSSFTKALRGWAGEWKGPESADQQSQKALPRIQGVMLVVDDEKPNRLFLKDLLEECGATVWEASGGEEALEKAKQVHPDVALVDVNMPGMNGYEVCNALKDDPYLRNTAVIMVTARSRVEDIETGFELGAFDYIRKPFHSRELLARVQNACALKGQKDELENWKKQITRQLRVAGALQSALFNPLPLLRRACDARVAFSPSQHIGGDCFDLMERARGGVMGYVADVAGHGVASALISTLLKAIIGEAFQQSADNSLHEIGNLIHRKFRELIKDPELYASCFLFDFDSDTRILRALNCGHPLPLLFDVNGKNITSEIPEAGGMPLGMWPRKHSDPYHQDDVMEMGFPDGAYLYIYTDGLTEARDKSGREAGVEELSQVCEEGLKRTGKHSGPGMLLAALRSRRFDLMEDDCTLMSLRMIPGRHLLCEGEVRLRADQVDSVGSQMEEKLLAVEWSKDAASLLRLVVMEHLMNVVDHAGLPEEAVCTYRQVLSPDSGSCELLFKDGGRKLPQKMRNFIRQKTVDPQEEHGRGLLMIDAICQQQEYFRREGENNFLYEISKNVTNQIQAQKLGGGQHKQVDQPGAEEWTR